jgi:Zn-dependent protease
VRSYTLLRIWKIPIRVNTSLLVFLPVLAWLIGSGAQIELYADLVGGLTGVGFDPAILRAGATPWVIGVAAAVGLFVSVTIHELGHSWVALRYGIGIESITLWILGGLASLESMPREWDREFWIALAGPVTSLLVAGGCLGGTLLAPAGLQVPRFVLGYLAVTNVALAVFNMLPAFPMDGGRILRALLARTRPYGVATRLAARVGVGFAVLFAVVGVLGFQLLLVLLALFVYSAATTESRTVLLDELLDGLTVGDVATRTGAVDADATVADLGARMLRERQTVFPVAEDGRVVGLVTLAALRDVDADVRDRTSVREVTVDVPRFETTADAFDGLAAMGAAGADSALVTEADGVVGVLSEEDFGRALTVRREFRVGEFRAGT